MVGEVEAAPSMVEEEGGVMTAEAALLRLATSLTGMIGVSGVSVLLTPDGEGGGARKHSKLGSTCNRLQIG